MSLVRLLTTGKCLVALRDSVSRYRMRRSNLLPKFGSRRNPFAARLHSVSDTTSTRPLSADEIAAARLKQTQRLPAAPCSRRQEDSSALPEKSRPSMSAKVLGRLRAWTGKLNPLAIVARWKTAPKPAIPRFDRAAVQEELRLDNVKVVRNDLNDADVELVPAKPAVRAQPGATRRAEAEPIAGAPVR